ncbi:RING-type E3 ubiquitin transferase [Ranunculus cassubicifolius]
MGNSSSRRNNNNNSPNYPPQHHQQQPPPSSYPPDHNPSSSSSSPPPPPNFVFAANAPYSAAPYPPPPQNPYPPPPPSQPHPSYYQYSGGYNSNCGYGNPPMMNLRSNYPPGYYGNQNNGWPGMRMPPPPQVRPPFMAAPYVDHQEAKKIRNDVNVHKDTIKIEVDVENPDCFLISMTLDALIDGSITIIYFAKEEPNCSFIPLYPDSPNMSVRIPFLKGLGQKFRQPSGTGVDLGFFDMDDLSKPSPNEEVFPLVILAEGLVPQSDEPFVDQPRPVTSSSNSQITQAIIEKNNAGDLQVKVIKQILWVDGVRYELREIYGIAKSAETGFDDSDPGKECVICMSEPKDTAVLPCRHMCMCSDCAKELRLMSNKCPICRQPIEQLIEIRVNKDEQ